MGSLVLFSLIEKNGFEVCTKILFTSENKSYRLQGLIDFVLLLGNKIKSDIGSYAGKLKGSKNKRVCYNPKNRYGREIHQYQAISRLNTCAHTFFRIVKDVGIDLQAQL